jgi:hypothetical protein
MPTTAGCDTVDGCDVAVAFLTRSSAVDGAPAAVAAVVSTLERSPLASVAAARATAAAALVQFAAAPATSGPFAAVNVAVATATSGAAAKAAASTATSVTTWCVHTPEKARCTPSATVVAVTMMDVSGGPGSMTEDVGPLSRTRGADTPPLPTTACAMARTYAAARALATAAVEAPAPTGETTVMPPEKGADTFCAMLTVTGTSDGDGDAAVAPEGRVCAAIVDAVGARDVVEVMRFVEAAGVTVRVAL